MSRGRRSPEDPQRWPDPCSRCGQHYATARRWPDGRVCGYCYQAAKRTTGTCACGHQGVLPGRINGTPACRACSGIRLNIDCIRCGVEGELVSAGRCWACTLSDEVTSALADPATGQIPADLLPVATALATMKRANSGVAWIRQAHVAQFLRQLAALPEISHHTIDALPDSRTREYVRGLLVEHGPLPWRDPRRARFIQWTAQALQRLPEGTDRDLVNRYIRWHLLRRMNTSTPVGHSTFLTAKQNVTVAINFLTWLHNEHDKTLATLTQQELDQWQSEGPSTRLRIDRFLSWTQRTREVAPNLEVRSHRRGTASRLDIAVQHDTLDLIASTTEIPARDRFAAILVLVFAQPIERVSTMAWDDISIDDESVVITLGDTPIALPDPLADVVRELQAQTQANTAAHPNSKWVFPGGSPGQPMDPNSLRNQLRELTPARAARLGTLQELAKSTPAPILAEALAYSPETIERHALAASYGQYVAVKRATQ